MKKRFVVIVYDISDDKRRTRLHKALLNYGSPVQYSVFECLLEPEALKRMKAEVGGIIKPRIDRVRYYTLCQKCLKMADVTSGPAILHESDVIVI